MNAKIVGAKTASMSILALRDYCDSPPAQAQVKVNGLTPLQRAETLLDRHEKAVHAKQVGRFNAFRSDAVERIEDADETLDLVPEKLESWLTAMRRGELRKGTFGTAEEAQAFLDEIRGDN